MTQLKIQWEPVARVRISSGPLAAERTLLEELSELLPHPANPREIQEPVLLVVPSRSLRLHLLARILDHRGSAILGLDCRTHHGLALTILERANGPVPTGPDLFPLFARRLARREAPLSKSLDHLQDGYSAILGPVRDLLDAGIDPAHTEALEEALAAEARQVSKQELERAQSLVRIATGTLAKLREHGASRVSMLLQTATDLLRTDTASCLAARRVIIYGFNDATGVATDFLLALVSGFGGSFYLEDPPDPASRTDVDPGLSFSRNFRERILTTIPSRTNDVSGSPIPRAPRLELFGALGGEAEVREIAERIRGLLDDSRVTPERIGVVARQIEPYITAIRTQFSRLGIPFSGMGKKIGPFDPRRGRLQALLQLLRERRRTPVERWLDATEITPEPAIANDLLVAFQVLGAARLEDAAALRTTMIRDRGGLRLPIPTGFEKREGRPSEASAPAYRVASRWLPAESIAKAVKLAVETCVHFDAWPAKATADQHTETLTALLGQILGWKTRRSAGGELAEEVLRVAGELPSRLELDVEEFLLFLVYELSNAGRTELGGGGGGVQVLNVIEARSRTFDHLFLMGLNRGTFPRSVEEDPLLKDPLRHALGKSGFGVLPDLPVKKKGFHEERYLFAQILSSSPRITLSWQDVDDHQNLRAVSPLVERLRLANGGQKREALPSQPTARPIYSPSPSRLGLLRPPHEVAVLAGLQGRDEKATRRLYGSALTAALSAADTEDAEAVAGARLRILDELDPPTAKAEAVARTGPFFGFAGPVTAEHDPRQRTTLPVTALEKLAACPWQHFLKKTLGLETLTDPLEMIRGIEPLLVGRVVHDALEAIVMNGLETPAEDWEKALESRGHAIEWPSSKELDQLLDRKARFIVLDENVGLPGLDTALARAARPHLESAQSEDWPSGISRWSVIAAEISATLETPGNGDERRVYFRADRMDRTAEGYAFTDYKTGHWTPEKGKSGSADQRLLDAVRSGEWLQAAAYALAGGQTSRGRYLFLHPDFDDDAGRVYSVGSRRELLRQSFEHTVSALFEIWEAGILFPRLLDFKGEKEPGRCSFCDVSDACIRGDSGSRRRIRQWMESDFGPAAAVWCLGKPEDRRKKPRK